MIGQVHLAWIDCHLRQIYPMHNDSYFRGLNVLLVGDFYQLPPVRQTTLYSSLPAPCQSLFTVERKPVRQSTELLSLIELYDRAVMTLRVLHLGLPLRSYGAIL
jgi:hypothetical protein